MRGLFITLAAVALCFGCQTSQVSQISAEPSVPAEAIAQARADFLAAPDVRTRLERLMELEQQALQLSADEPLKLGSIGSAILDLYYGSQTGHYVMGIFYGHVESAEAKAPHDAWLNQLQNTMKAANDGTRESPFEVMTIYDGYTYARSQGASPVGSIYQSTDEMPFGALVIARKDTEPVQHWFFNMSQLLERVMPEDAVPGDKSAWPLIREFASRMDTAAQTAIGAFLTSSRNYDAAAGWLRVASRTGNMLANTLLARIYWTQAEQAEDESVRKDRRELSQENHLHAVTLGSTESMYALAHLYLEGHFGEDNTDAALALLEQAGALQHVESLLYLGYLYNLGQVVPADLNRANEYFQRAAALEDPQAVISYGRFLVTVGNRQTTGEILGWLETLAQDGRADAMVILGNLYARGVGASQSNSRALRWYKKAVKRARDDADIVNEVAWTLTVSDIDGLQRTKYAKRIMDSLMQNNEKARGRPEYLDTWAATHAASGDFGEAMNLQAQAIAAATNQDREDVMDILKEHLELFRAGATITEKAP